MISYNLDKRTGILTVQPEGKLEARDFQGLSQTLDPFIEEKGKLKGLIIVTKRFPGWKNFTGMIEHMKFVRGHLKEFAKVALVTDTKVADIAELLGRYFTKTSIRHFSAGEIEPAQKWITQD